MKKGQIQDNVDMIAGVILIIIGVLILQFAQSDLQRAYTSPVNYAEDLTIDWWTTANSNVDVLDITFIGTDLLNVLRYPLTETVTLGDLIIGMEETFPTIPEDGNLEKYVYLSSSVFECTQSLREELHNFLGPTYGLKWSIQVKDYEEDRVLFYCKPQSGGGSSIASSNVTLPTQNPEKTIVIFLEVSS